MVSQLDNTQQPRTQKGMGRTLFINCGGRENVSKYDDDADPDADDDGVFAKGDMMMMMMISFLFSHQGKRQGVSNATSRSVP